MERAEGGEDVEASCISENEEHPPQPESVSENEMEVDGLLNPPLNHVPGSGTEDDPLASSTSMEVEPLNTAAVPLEQKVSSTPMEVEPLISTTAVPSEQKVCSTSMEVKPLNTTADPLKEKASSTSMEVENSDTPFTEDLLNKLCKEASTSFFSKFGLISHQINSFNDFLGNGIQSVFSSLGEITIAPGSDPPREDSDTPGAVIKFGNVKFEKPMFCAGEVENGDDKSKKSEPEKKYLKLLPRHARLQHMTYSAVMKAEIEFQVYTLESKKCSEFKTDQEKQREKKVITEGKSEVVIGRIPVMVGSNLCWTSGGRERDCEFDLGGYFLIKGMEKVFIAQERVCLKRLWVYDKPKWSISYRSAVKMVKVNIEELNPDGRKIIEELNPHGRKILNVQFMSCTIPLWILFYALGMPSDKDIVEMIDVDTSDTRIDNLLFSTMEYTDDHCKGFRRNQQNCLERIDELFVGAKFPLKAKECLETLLFPNLSSLKQKAIFLGYMVRCLLQSYIGKRKCENVDDFRNKRLDLANELLERELRIHVKNAQRHMVKAMQRDLYGNRSLRSIDYYLDDSIISNGLSKAFSTGQWSHQFKGRIPGVVAGLRRTNALQTMADMRKTRLPVHTGKQQVRSAGKLGGARIPHPSHRGRLCFLSTQDGVNCGLVKNMAVTGLVSTNSVEPLLDTLYECGMEKLVEDPSPSIFKGKVKIFWNGEWCGVCEDSVSFVHALRSKRRSQEISQQVEIKRDQQQREVRIFSDFGRIMRPLLVVENLEKIKEFKGDYGIHSLMNKGIIELVGVEEEEDYQIAWGVRRLLFSGDQGYTHCELDPSFLLGVSCGLIPFANHDHAKRVLYQSEKHSQQAIGISTTNPNIRADTLSHQIYYPQRPLFCTMLSDCLVKPEYHQHPNVHQQQQQTLPRPEIYNGQNAIVAVNVHGGYNQEDSIVMNRASIERGMFRTEHIRSYRTEFFNNETKRLRTKDKLYFGKTSSKTECSEKLDKDGFPHIGAQLESGDIIFGRHAESEKDKSIRLKHTEKGVVERVILSANDEGKNFAAVFLRQVRAPSVGDKFSSMHGQKGVIGFLDSQENFPFTCQGIVPDIVINPHAFPSRQTVGQLLEAVLGKGIASGGMTRYATPFTTPSTAVITEQLHRAGFSRWGRDRVYSGWYGHMMQSMIFVGPNFYQRLTMISEDQVKYRNTGPVNPCTRQPVQDRKRFGGIKFGEMERDCILAHGAAANLHERLLPLSDLCVVYTCSKCSKIATKIQIQVPGGRKVPRNHCQICNSAKYLVKVNMPYGVHMLYRELFSMGISMEFHTEPAEQGDTSASLAASSD